MLTHCLFTGQVRNVNFHFLKHYNKLSEEQLIPEIIIIG